MIGAADESFERDSEEDICASCCKLSEIESCEWQVGTQQPKYSRNAENKGFLLQQIQIAANLQDIYQPNLKHLQIPQNCQHISKDVITTAMHDVLVDRLRSLSRYYSHSAKTFFLAVNIMDRFLSVVKAKPHHLLCIAVASYYLAVKSIEKEKDVMSPDHLVRISQCGCSTSDIARMEKIICSKLKWELDSPSALTFLEVFHAWCVAESIMGNKEDQHQDHMEQLTNILEGCMCNFPLTLFQPSVLAFTLLSIQLPRYITVHNTSDMENLDWVLTGLQHFTKMSSSDIQRCQCLLRDFLLDYCSSKCKRPTSKLVWIVSSKTAKNMRFSAQISSDLQTIPEDSTLLSDPEISYDSSSDEIWEANSSTEEPSNPIKHPIMVVTAPSSKSAQFSDPSKHCALPDVTLFTAHSPKYMAYCVL
ncbi:cyclin-G1-like [Amphiura filiformis]|uniref:cyclin-G1-like n=1 Tax=Amphiura filiformis TaxID=82378 RepID=UPI003B20E2C2